MPDSPTALDAAALFVRYAPFVARFLARYGVAAIDVDDVLQDVFVVAHARGGYAPGPAKPTSYLAAIAVRVLSTHRRRSRARSRVRPDPRAVEAAVSTERGPAVDVELTDAMRTLHAALEALSPSQRAAFILFELEGESCVSIAAALDVPVGTIHSRLHAARAALRERLARRGYTRPCALLTAENHR